MKPTVMDLREALESRDFDSFLSSFPALAVEEMHSASKNTGSFIARLSKIVGRSTMPDDDTPHFAVL